MFISTTLQQIEEEDSNTRRDEAYKRIVAIAKKKVMNALKEIQVPPKVADTVFDINLHKEKLVWLHVISFESCLKYHSTRLRFEIS